MSLRPLRQLGWLLTLWLLLCSPSAWAVLCSEVWPAGSGLNQYVPPLNIPSYTATTSLVASNPRTVVAGSSYWLGGSSSTNWQLIAPTSGTALVYVQGNLYIDNNSRINASGSARNLVLIISGNLTIANSNNTVINALVYATGNATLGNNPAIIGGVSVGGSLSQGNNVSYEPGVVAGTDFGTLCDNPDSVGQIHHYRFLHAATGLSCNPLDVQLQACATAACDRLYLGSINATLSPTTWVGGNQANFYNGQTALKLNGAGTVTLGISSVIPAANNPLTCSTSNCAISFADSGFIFDVPTLLARKTQSAISLQAVRKDDTTQKCVPGFAASTRTLQFWSDHVDPGSGTLPVTVNGSTVSTSSSTPTSLSLTFDSTATTQLAVSYADAGLMRLNAQYVGSASSKDNGLLMTGSDQFVSKPYGLHLSTPSDSSCTAATVAGCPLLRAAGDSFPLTIRAVAWQADGEALTAAALADNPTTPNFRQTGIALSSSLQAPAGGNAGSLSLTSYDHAVGSQTVINPSESEVGIFTLSATPPAAAYFGETVSGGSSALVGRFTPAYLGSSLAASLTPACGTFSYQQQWINFGSGPLLAITGYNRQGGVTGNYDVGEFWRLASAPQRQTYSSVSGRSTLDPRLTESGSTTSTAQTDSISRDGSRSFLWSSQQLQWSAAVTPTADDLPLLSTVNAVRLTVPASSLTDADGICYLIGGVCSAATLDFGGSELRLGRLRFGNAYGSELQSLAVPFWLESWRSNSGFNAFLPETADSCSAPLLGTPALTAVAGSGPLLPANIASSSVSAPVAGLGAVNLSAPGVTGSLGVGLSGLNGTALPWLWYDWNGDGSREAATGLATFGIYPGEKPLIYRRESFR